MKNALHVPFILGAIFSLFITGCSSTSTTHTIPTIDSPPIKSKRVTTKEHSVKQLIIDAENKSSPMREELLIEAMKMSKAENNVSQFKYLISIITPDGLPPEIFGDYLLVVSQFYIDENNLAAATDLLEGEETVEQIRYMSRNKTWQVYSIRAKLFTLIGDHASSARVRSWLIRKIPEGESVEEQYQALWQSLLNVSLDELNQLQQKTDDNILQGWYSLAALTKDSSDIDQQVKLLNEWLSKWPDHPGKKRLPNRLQLLQSFAASRPQKLILFLPLEGELKSAGRAIQEGFFAAFYQSLHLGNPTPKITVIDTSSISDANFLQSYIAAIQANSAELVIGPLEKEKVKILMDQPSLPIPTLALNTIPEVTNTPEQLYQFGLAVEDEIAELVNRAKLANYKQALIITPETPWGNRVAVSLRDQWTSLGGQIIGISGFNEANNFSTMIQSALNITESEQRAKKIKTVTSRDVEFTPRRRQDIDVIFLAVNPQQARQIKPTLAFHYAGDIPVFAISRVYSGVAEPEKDQDLNGIMFTDIPWNFENSEIKKTIQKATYTPPAYQRLTALGIDAFRLYPRLKQLETIPNTKLYGKTGSLQLSNNRVIHREQIWGMFSKGKPTLIPSLTKNEIDSQI